MRAVYVEKTTNELNYFVCTWNDEDKELEFKNIKSIAAKAFQNTSIVKRVFFKENLSEIGKEAFKGCDDLDLFFCEKDTFLQPTENKDEDDDDEIYCIKSTEKNKNSNSVTTFAIESLAFSKCKNLLTVVLPECGMLSIEKDAFDGCSSLRRVVCFADKIDFTGNPFESCPETLAFVGKKGSQLERFARENGYRFIDA